MIQIALVTGGTGFLGKRVLESLLGSESTVELRVVSRSKSSYPDPRVKIINADLTDPECVDELQDALKDVDSVFHLAGLYDFKAGFSENYLNNVLGTTHICRALKQFNQGRRVKIPIYYTSTYAVGQVRDADLLLEEAVDKLPSHKNAYALTKAIAERVVTDSELPGVVFRLGVLVGDSKRGRIEKLDGPYYLMSFLKRAARVPGVSLLKRIPVPASSGGVLPLVPVDIAAKAITEAAERGLGTQSGQELFGVYDPESVELHTFCNAVFQQFVPKAKPLLLEHWPNVILKRQQMITRIPRHIFEFSISPIELDNSKFVSTFGAGFIPKFEDYQEQFFHGFKEYMDGNFTSAGVTQ